MEEELKKYGLKVYWHNDSRHNSSDPDDYEPIDFSIEDGEDNVAWVWGSEPFNDVQIECNHPYECVDFGNDENECGECQICGAQCDWHWVYDVVDEGHDMDGRYYAKEGEVREITEWYYPKKIGGSVGESLKELQEKW